MRSPPGGKARRRGGTQVGKAPPSPEMTISGLTKGQFVGDDDVAKQFIIPRLCRTVRPAPQAGCFVSGLSVSCESQITLRHRAFGTVALAPSRTLSKSNSVIQHLLPEKNAVRGSARSPQATLTVPIM